MISIPNETDEWRDSHRHGRLTSLAALIHSHRDGGVLSAFTCACPRCWRWDRGVHRGRNVLLPWTRRNPCSWDDTPPASAHEQLISLSPPLNKSTASCTTCSSYWWRKSLPTSIPMIRSPTLAPPHQEMRMGVHMRCCCMQKTYHWVDPTQRACTFMISISVSTSRCS